MDMITNIIALITAIIGFVGSIYIYLTNRTTRKILPMDNSIIISKVLRNPLDEIYWKSLKSPPLPTSLVFLLLMVVIIVSARSASNIIIHSNSQSTDLSSYYYSLINFFGSLFGTIITLIIIIQYTYIVVNIFLRRQKLGKTPEEARFFIFDDAYITVVAEYNDIINRCYKVLKVMKSRSVELNTDAQYLEAQKTFRLNTAVGIVRIEIKPIYSTHVVIINPNNKREYSIKVSFQTRYSQSIELKSRIINSFIEQFIGQTKP